MNNLYLHRCYKYFNNYYTLPHALPESIFHTENTHSVCTILSNYGAPVFTELWPVGG
jgi:hypothetical protein